jgi:hypothetical protein
MGKIEYYIYQPGTLDYHEFHEYLKEVDHLLIPPLSSRVDLAEYAERVCNRAILFVAKHGEEWVGVEAVYFNEYPEFSFTTHLSVKKEYQEGGKVGMELMLRQLRYLKEHRTKGLRFSIRKSNRALLNYHLKTGGRIISEHTYPGTDIEEVEMEKIYIKD